MTAATTSAAAAWMRGQLVVLRTTTAMLREARFCWYLRFASVVTSTSRLWLSAAAANSPFFKVDQPHSYAVETP